MLEQYNTDIQVPTHLRERAAAINEKFQVLVGKATERTNQITETLNSWREFHSGLEEFSTWLRRRRRNCMSSVKVVEMFLMEFSSLESRLEVRGRVCGGGVRGGSVEGGGESCCPVYVCVCVCVCVCVWLFHCFVCVQLLCEEVEERRGKFESLGGGSQRHLLGEEEEEVRKLNEDGSLCRKVSEGGEGGR